MIRILPSICYKNTTKGKLCFSCVEWLGLVWRNNYPKHSGTDFTVEMDSAQGVYSYSVIRSIFSRLAPCGGDHSNRLKMAAAAWSQPPQTIGLYYHKGSTRYCSKVNFLRKDKMKRKTSKTTHPNRVKAEIFTNIVAP